MDKIKCNNCGFINIKGTRICTKCGTNIDVYKKSCPRCGKVNSNNVKRCVRCNFDFMKKKKTIWFYLLISCFIMLLLFLLGQFISENAFNKFSLALKVLAGFMVFVVLVRTLTYGSKDKINYSAEEEIVEDHKGFDRMKKFSNLTIIVGGILVIVYLIYYYFIK